MNNKFLSWLFYNKNQRCKHFFRIMKISTLFLFLLIFCLHAENTNSQNVRVTVKQDNMELQKVLNEIEKQTDYLFVYDKYVNVNRKVSINSNKRPLKEVLGELFEGTNVKYSLDGNYIVLSSTESKNNERNEKISLTAQQEKKITGTVKDEKGEPVIGANVVVKGTTSGTVTDINGNFSLLIIGTNVILEISFVGYVTQDVSIGTKTKLNILLAENSKVLDEVVVTSFGIRKTMKQLTYSTQELKGDEMTKTGNPNVLSNLQGKIAGVSVSLNSGMLGKGPDIKIRGSRSLTGDNRPLYVVDGMPISGGDRTADLNPNDIETINILKGPAASALYGLRASNGVVIITTKSGSGTKGKPTIELTSNYSFEKIGMLPDTQMEFAQGNNGVFNANAIYAWGPRISTMSTYINQLGEMEEPGVYDNDKDFFQTGSTWNSNLTFSNNSDIGHYLFGIGRSDQTGIVPNTSMERTNFKFNGTFKLIKNLSSSLSINYSEVNIHDLPELAGNQNIFRGLMETPPSYNLKGKPYAKADDPYAQIFYRATQNNPYWIVNNCFRKNKTKRTFGNIYLKYDFNAFLSLNYRIGIDHYDTSGNQFLELGMGDVGRTNPPSGGSYTISNNASDIINSNAYLSFNKTINNDWSIDFIVGNELYDSRSKSLTSVGSNLIQGNWPNLGNATDITSSNYEYKQRIVGFYANANIGWKNKLFLNGSGRNDIVSNMPSKNRSFFYPSLGLSGIVTELIPITKKLLSYGKVRTTIAEVGQAGSMYVNSRGFVKTNPGGYTFPYLGLTSWTQSSTRISPNLKPQNTKSIEIGTDLRFFNNRVGIDYTYYINNSDGQIFEVPVPITTGASTEISNGGQLKSYGHEIMLNLIPIQTHNFKWEFNTNFNTYSNKVKKLYGSTERITIGASDVISVVAEKGQTFPSFYGSAYLRDPESGEIIYESNPNKQDYGKPLKAPQNKVIGTPKPDFEISFINSFSYKDFSLSFQLDWKRGGQIFSQSYIEGIRRGAAGITRDREELTIPDGKKGTVVDGILQVVGDNDTQIKKDMSFYSNVYSVQETGLQDASYLRLREVNFSYNIPQKILSKTFIKNASIFVTGRNLFLITDSYVDPEVNMSEGSFQSTNSQGVEISQIPQSRSYGFGINVKF